MKLKNILGKALVVGAIAAATMVVGAVTAFAADVEYDTPIEYNMANLSGYTTSATVSSSAAPTVANESKVSASTVLKFSDVTNSHNVKTVNSLYYLELTNFTDANYNKALAPTSNTKAVVSVDLNRNDKIKVYYYLSDSKCYNYKSGNLTFAGQTSTPSSTSDTATEPITAEFTVASSGTYEINSSSNRVVLSSLVITPAKASTAATYSVSGTITADDGVATAIAGNVFEVLDSNSSVVATGTISNDGTTFSFGDTLEDGSYTIIADWFEYEIVDGAELTVSGANITDKVLKIGRKSYATINGTVDNKLAVVGDSINFTNGLNEKSAIIDENLNYSIELPIVNEAYTVDLDMNSTYVNARYTIKDNSVSVENTGNITKNIEASDEITTWTFSELPAYKIEGTTGTFKGIVVDATNGKFDAQPADNRVQFNANTLAKIPLSSPSDKVTWTSNKGTCTITYYADYAVIKATENDYLNTVSVTTKTTPALALSTTGTGVLEAVIYNASAENEISSIVVRNADSTKSTNITNIKEVDGNYGFTANITNSADVEGAVDLVYGTTTVTYGFSVAADGTVTVNA